MRIILDDIVFSLQTSGGISRFWSKLVAHHAGNTEARFIERISSDNLYRQAMRITPDRVIADHKLPLRLSRYLDFGRAFGGSHVFHSSYYRSNRHPRAINLTTVHDMMYEKFEHGLARTVHVRQKSRALRFADCLVCVSDATRRDLLELYPFCAAKRIEIIPNGVDPMDTLPTAALPGAVLGRRFVLYVGHRGTCKGFDRTFDLLDALPGEICAVVGAPFSAEEVRAITTRGLEQRIVNVGRVDDATLSALYAAASFFFFPSIYEGFGIPPVEAMQHGCVVLASNRSSVPEVVGDAALMFDPDDRDTMIRNARLIMAGEGVPALRERGYARAAALNWRTALDRYDGLYSDLLHDRAKRTA